MGLGLDPSAEVCAPLKSHSVDMSLNLAETWRDHPSLSYPNMKNLFWRTMSYTRHRDAEVLSIHPPETQERRKLQCWVLMDCAKCSCRIMFQLWEWENIYQEGDTRAGKSFMWGKGRFVLKRSRRKGQGKVRKGIEHPCLQVRERAIRLCGKEMPICCLYDALSIPLHFSCVPERPVINSNIRGKVGKRIEATTENHFLPRVQGVGPSFHTAVEHMGS